MRFWDGFDANEVIIDLCFGEGGDDSKMFVEELYDAYSKYARSLNLKFELLHSSDGHKIAKVSGSGAGNSFRHETGKHVVQRIPETESKGRKQTSVVSVGVMPIKKQSGDEELRDQDLEIIFQTGKQGAGGQNVNKVASACRMKHTPTGFSVFINGRDQYQNKVEARSILTAKVNDMKRQERDAEYSAFRKIQMGDGSRGDKIRTYNFMRGEIVDHRLNKTTKNVKSYMKGNLDVLFGE